MGQQAVGSERLDDREEGYPSSVSEMEGIATGAKAAEYLLEPLAIAEVRGLLPWIVSLDVSGGELQRASIPELSLNLLLLSRVLQIDHHLAVLGQDHDPYELSPSR